MVKYLSASYSAVDSAMQPVFFRPLFYYGGENIIRVRALRRNRLPDLMHVRNGSVILYE